MERRDAVEGRSMILPERKREGLHVVPLDKEGKKRWKKICAINSIPLPPLPLPLHHSITQEGRREGEGGGRINNIM